MTDTVSDFTVVIPTRYASTRLPGKPLLDIAGKPMIEWVYQVAASSRASEVFIATDDERIASTVREFGGNAVQTASSHQTGSDRVLEVCNLMQWPDNQVVVNLQGDEPLMPAENLTQVASNLVNSGCDMATLFTYIDPLQANNPNQVKVVCDEQGKALYFSRALIPCDRDQSGFSDYRGHVGLYAYRVGFLRTFAGLAPSTLEQIEKLEQLRALEQGYSIHVAEAAVEPGPGVDTEEDLQRVRTLFNH